MKAIKDKEYCVQLQNYLNAYINPVSGVRFKNWTFMFVVNDMKMAFNYKNENIFRKLITSM